ncbi:unnamed protein product [Rotaria sordida]|uniref:FERM domain-containing protein n=1 Tax=Rotaria sordida TaxID=392033 RepID=A0A814CQN1_9BILA|nr:unnamed protein product [Rotaria sordida]
MSASSENLDLFTPVFKHFRHLSDKDCLIQAYSITTHPTLFQQCSLNISIDVDSSLGLQPISTWSLYSCKFSNGLYFLSNPFTLDGQRQWINRCLNNYARQTRTSVGDNSDNQNLTRIRWATLGYHYDWTNKIYKQDDHTNIPDELVQLSQTIAQVISSNTNCPMIYPEAVIINYYHLNSTLCAHTDHSEYDALTKPLLSISFGNSAIFLIGGQTKTECQPSPMLLHSGDIIIMTGTSRLCFHAIPRILSDPFLNDILYKNIDDDNDKGTVKGHTLFSLVCQTIGLREHWYFGLKFLDKISNEWTWLQMNRTILSQPIQIQSSIISSKRPESPNSTDNLKPHLLRSPPTSPSTSTLSLPLSSSSASGGQQSINILELYFVVKFYPEEITNELIQDITRHLFYLQVKQDILNMDIYCPPDTAAHLASLALQAKFGDYDQITSSSESLNLESEALLPLSCFQKVELSRSDWFDRIIALWRTHASLAREESEMAYLKHAQDLDMFGLSFFEISKMQGGNKSNLSSQQQQSDQSSIATELWLGIDSLGIRFYKKNKLRPEVFFSWSDIKSVTAHDKKVILNMTGDKNATFAFYSGKSSVSKEILDLATGNHELYMKRRREQSIEIQQMRYFEEQQQKEKHRTFARERQLRLQAEKERDEIGRKFDEYQQQMKDIHDTLLKYQEAAELLARKAHISSEEARLQAEKALEIETQLERCKYEISRNEEEKRLYARQISECEQIISTLVNDSVKSRKEAEELKIEVAKWRVAEAAAREKLLSITQLNQSIAVTNAAAQAQQNLVQSSSSPRALSPPPYRPILRNQESNQSDERALLIEKQSKQAQLALQLQDLKNVIQSKKIEQRQTFLDKAYEENLAVGDNKYSTIQKASSGTASKRMAMLQDL